MDSDESFYFSEESLLLDITNAVSQCSSFFLGSLYKKKKSYFSCKASTMAYLHQLHILVILKGKRRFR